MASPKTPLGMPKGPLDVVEELAQLQDWSYDRTEDNEVTLIVVGRESDYQAVFTWMEDIESLHCACSFDLKMPEVLLPQMKELITLINSGPAIGHFDLWSKDGMVVWRYALQLPGG